MNNEIVQDKAGQIIDPMLDAEGMLPLSSREVFWRAKFLDGSEAVDHLPFVFWTVGNVRPRRAVTINMVTGTAHFALCQAVERMALDTDCQGFTDTADGGVPEPLRLYNDTQYEEFSQLSGAGPAQAARFFDPGTVDLLIVDGPVGQTTLEGLRDDWKSCLSDRGVALIFGVSSDRLRSDPALSALLAERGSWIHFRHGAGLLVLLAGKAVSPQLARLARLDENDPMHRALHRLFGRLGAMHRHAWSASDMSARLAERDAEIARLREAAGPQMQGGAQDGDLDAVERMLLLADEEAARADRLQADLAEARAEAARCRDEAEGLARKLKDRAQELSKLTSRADRLSRDLTQARTTADQASQKLAKTHAAMKDRDARIETQRRESRETEQALGLLRDECGALRDALTTRSAGIEARDRDLAAAKARIAKLREELAAYKAAQQELMASTSWRITSPVRRLGAAMRRGS